MTIDSRLPLQRPRHSTALVSGGAGFIGLRLAEKPAKRQYQVAIFGDLRIGRRKLALRKE